MSETHALAALREIATGKLTAEDCAQLAVLVLRRVEATASLPDEKNFPAYRFDLRTSEITLLKRSLRIYAKSYQESMQRSAVAWEKEESKRYIEAADALGDKLMKSGTAVAVQR